MDINEFMMGYQPRISLVKDDSCFFVKHICINSASCRYERHITESATFQPTFSIHGKGKKMCEFLMLEIFRWFLLEI